MNKAVIFLTRRSYWKNWAEFLRGLAVWDRRHQDRRPRPRQRHCQCRYDPLVSLTLSHREHLLCLAEESRRSKYQIEKLRFQLAH